MVITGCDKWWILKFKVKKEVDYVNRDKVSRTRMPLKIGKSEGIDWISPEVLKNMEPKGTEIFQWYASL